MPSSSSLFPSLAKTFHGGIQLPLRDEELLLFATPSESEGARELEGGIRRKVAAGGHAPRAAVSQSADARVCLSWKESRVAGEENEANGYSEREATVIQGGCRATSLPTKGRNWHVRRPNFS